MLPPEPKFFPLEEENLFLRQRVQELCALYEQITCSKAWKLVDFLRCLKAKILKKTSNTLTREKPLAITEYLKMPIEQKTLEELTRALAQSEKIILEEREHTKQLLDELNKSKWAAIDLLENIKPATPVCPLCGHTNENFAVLESECIFGGGKLSRLQCPSCDCIFGPHKMLAMTPELLAQDYKFLYKYYAEGDTTEYAIRSFHHLASKPHGLYLDYGAGIWTKTLPVLREKGFNVLGYEPYSAVHSNNASGSFIQSPETLKKHRFDGIFSTNVLEHFQNPIQALIEMRNLLKPGGRMAHATACFEYSYEFSRFHLFFFPGRSAHVLAKRAGLRIIHEENEGEYRVRVFEPIDTET